MNEKEYSAIVARNLRNIMYERDVTQAKMASDLKITKSTIDSGIR